MRWTDELLDGLRAEGDPPADLALAALVAQGSARGFDAWLQAHPHNGDPLPVDVPAEVRALFDGAAAVAAAADPVRGEAGRALFFRYGVPCLQGLLYRSLPELYAAAPGAEALNRSRRIADDGPRRVMETLQFVVDVLAPDALGPRGRGVRSTVRVRLVHAAARWRLSQAPDRHVFEGVAVNQEDLAATLVAFSAVLLDVLHTLGVDTGRAEDDAWMSVWNTVGGMLGVRADLRFADADDARALLARFRERHHRPSEAGRALATSLLAFADTLLPGDALDGLNVTALRTLAGDTVADVLGVPPLDWTRVFVAPYRLLVSATDAAEDASPVARALAGMLGRAFLQRLLATRLPDGHAFSLPDALEDAWIQRG